MNPRHIFLTAIFLGAMGVPAVAEKYRVSQSTEIANPDRQLWAVIGDFCDLDDWHPAVISCALKSRDGAVHRVLQVDGGAEFVERLIAVEPGLSYTYSIVSSPLPLENYTATLAITGGKSATVTWSGNFSSDDPAMEGVISDIYASGLAAIAARLSR